MVDAAAPGIPASEWQPDRRPGRAVPLLVTLGILVVGAITFVVQPVLASEWVATVKAVVEPRSPESSPLGAYQLDVLSRERVMPTFAALVDSRGVRDEAAREVGLGRDETDELSVDASASRGTSVITITVRGRDRSTTSDMALTVRKYGVRYVNGLGAPYRVRAVQAPGQVTHDNGILLVPTAQLVAAWALGGTAVVWLIRRSRQPA